MLKDIAVNKVKLMTALVALLFISPFLLTPITSFVTSLDWVAEVKLFKAAVCLSLMFYWHFYRQSSIDNKEPAQYSRRLIVYLLLFQVVDSQISYFSPDLLTVSASVNLLLSCMIFFIWHKPFITKRRADFILILIFASVLLGLVLFSMQGQSIGTLFGSNLLGVVGAGGLFAIGLMRLQYKLRNLSEQDLLPFVIMAAGYLTLIQPQQSWFYFAAMLTDILFIFVVVIFVFRLNRISSKDWQLLNHGMQFSENAFYCGDAQGTCQYVNPAYRALFGIGSHVAAHDIKPPLYTHPIKPSVDNALNNEGNWSGETVLMDNTGNLRPVFINATCVEINGISYHQAWFRNLDERVKFQQQENLMLEKLERLSFNLIEKQEEERRFFAKELHDEIGQGLTLLKIQQQLPEPDKELVTTVLAELIEKVRNLSLNLRPSILDDMGLAIALDWLVDRQKKFSQLTFHCQVDEEIPRIDEKVEISVFRIVQEAFTNIHKYAHANEVTLKAYRDKEYLWVTVSDDGVGFDVNTKISHAVKGQSLGLLGIQERIYLINGHVDIESSPESGTTIKLKVPCNPVPSTAKDGVKNDF